ncbi:MAG: type I CRISPR-associated protein Cas7, partial [Dictyoglomaceae bacterium]
MGKLKNRSEILFLYDITDANPNGDPMDENKPRIDEETGVNIVTDVRLKRTIRDYLYEYKGLETFVREVRDEKGELKT